MTARSRSVDGIKELAKTLGVSIRSLESNTPTSHVIGFLKQIHERLLQHHRCLETEFSEWLRKNPGLDSYRIGMSIHNLDWIIHQYKVPEDKNGPRRVNNLMIVEEKCFGAESSFAQLDTLTILDQLLTKKVNGKIKQQKVKTRRGDIVGARYFGLHHLVFSGSGPSTSDKITWDDQVITLHMLERILRFELHPCAIWKERDLSERRHHCNLAATTPHLPFLDL